MPTVGERDYDAPETMIVAEPAQLKAMADPFRVQLVQLMRDQARSTQELAEELGIPKGTVGHHLKVLESAGLIKVVRTRKVRAVTEKFYGRTARLFLYQTDDPDNNRTIASNTLRHAAGEVEAGAYTTGFGLVRARISKADKRRLNQRAQKLLDDFRAADTPGGEPWSMTLGLWTAEGDDADQ
jgi:DNA-binding transcriptional ArsR family regulator